MALPWDKLDVVTWSWQKVLGGEAAHGMLVLSPRAVERLESYTPAWPMPKIFRLTKGGKLNEGIFKGETINTPSHAVRGGCARRSALGGGHRRSAGADRALRGQSARRGRLGRRGRPGSTSSRAIRRPAPARRSACGSPIRGSSRSSRGAGEAAQEIVGLLEKEGVAYDIGAYRDAPPGLRIWGGATVETGDIEALLPWLDWAFATVRSGFAARASGASESQCPRC